MNKYIWLLVLFVFPASGFSQKEWTKKQVVDIIYRVNDHWQAQNPVPERAFWDNAAYHTGNMEAYFLTGKESYLRYSEAWAEHNEWKGAKSDDKANWKYSYGETDEYVLFGDWQICFQTYADLYLLQPDPKKIARAREVMEYQMSTTRNDYWWWADGLYMVMPVMTKLYKITRDPLYLEKLHEYFNYANSIMYDKDACLYYRDAKYVYPKHTSLGTWRRMGVGRSCEDIERTSASGYTPGRVSLPFPENGKGCCGLPAAGRLLDAQYARPCSCSRTGNKRDGILHVCSSLGSQ